MTYQELKQNYGEEVAARMWAVLSLEPKSVLIQSLLDFMGKRTLDQWSVAIKEVASEPADS